MRHSAGAVRSQSSVAGALPRDRIIIASCIVLVTALAWTYLIHLDRQMSLSVTPETMLPSMRMMIGTPWGAADFFFTFLMWSVMMVGMMSPSAAPVLLLFAELQSKRTQRRLTPTTLLFGLGYIALWIGFSTFAAMAQGGLHRAELLSSSMAATNDLLAGAVLVAAGVYQLTPAKSACLRQCRSPIGFLISNWRDGAKGAFEMGLRHGVYCLGCCWALMGVLFLVGVMNLAWVAALTAFILLEKFGRSGALVARVGGIAMIAFGLFVIVG